MLGKIIVHMTGPVAKYRLEIIKNACPASKDFFIFFTDAHSYSLYKEYYDFFKFVVIDDYRKNYPISLEYEVTPTFSTEEEYFANIHKFYRERNIFYPYDLHRFTLLYLMKHDILNFAIVDNDFIFTNNPERINRMFNSVEAGTFYGPWFEEDIRTIKEKKKMWKESVQPLYPQIKLEAPFLRTLDGFIRGFHFRNKEEMKLMFDIWNTAIEQIFINPKYRLEIIGHNNLIYHAEWVISHLMQFFEYQLKYQFKNLDQVFDIDGKRVGIHITRVEDTLALGSRYAWNMFNFNYSDATTISAFIKNNKEQLRRYYIDKFPIFEITDNYIYTKVD